MKNEGEDDRRGTATYPITHWIGEGAGWLLKHVVSGLAWTGLTPNMFTFLGLAVNAWAAAWFAMGRFRGAAAILFLAAFLDMADGQVARRVGRVTAFGAFLDSTLDRYSDLALYMGLVVYYTLIGRTFYMALAAIAMASSFMVSYSRARAESLIPHFRIGYWQRGERIAAVVISVFAYNIPAMLWQQAIGPAFTAWRRVKCTRDFLKGRPVIEDPRQGPWWVKLALWRWPRMTLPYDLITGANIAFLIFAPIPQVDLIRRLIQP
jgi:CDP-diacylglycerol--glycerol-3-phosphate 3-phosphatidyltransferase